MLSAPGLDELLAEGIRRVQRGAPNCSSRELFLSALQQRAPTATAPAPATAAASAAAEPEATPRAQAEAAQHALRIAAVAEQGRRGAVFSFPLTPRDAPDTAFIPTVHPKSAEATAAIGAALRNNLLFGGLAEDTLALLEAAAEPRQFPQGHAIQQAGQPGSHFFLITQGVVEVSTPHGAPMTLGRGSSFGEVALLYAAVCESSVTVVSDTCSAWAIDRHTFLHTTIEAMQRKRNLYGQFLRQVPLLAHLSEESIGRLADALLHVHVGAGEAVVAQGDASSGRCFLIEQGLLRVSSAGEDGQEAGAHTLGPGDCFGMESLSLEHAEGEVQPVSVMALEDARLLVMDRATALRLVAAPGAEEGLAAGQPYGGEE